MNVPPIKLHDQIRSWETESGAGREFERSSWTPPGEGDEGSPPASAPYSAVRLSEVNALQPRGSMALEAPPESLPVLAAFQEFLEQERGRLRNRALVLAGLILIVLLLVTGVGVLLSLTIYGQMKTDYREIREEMESFEKEAVSVKRDAENALSRLTRQAQSFQNDIASQVSVLDEVRERSEGQKGAINGMREIVKMLELENTELKRDLMSLQQEVPNLSARLEAAVKRMAIIRPQAPPAPEVASAPPPPQQQTLSFRIAPGDTGRSFTWRLPIPE